MHSFAHSTPDRRQFLAAAAAAGIGFSLSGKSNGEPIAETFVLKYLLGSCMYGYAELAEILPQVKLTGATAIDIWPKKHGNQREQLNEMGEEKFAELLEAHGVTLGCITRYHSDMKTLDGEMRLAKRLKCPLVVSAVSGMPEIKDNSIKGHLRHLFEQLKPQLAIAEENGVTLALENHNGNPINSPDSLKWFLEMRPSKHLALAYAPYHMSLDSEQHAALLRDVGEGVALFYAWQPGMGSKTKLPLEQQLLQMPGRGELDFSPMADALRSIKFQGWTEIFMHPFPRGIPILPTVAEVTGEINRSREYLDFCVCGPS